MPTWVIIVIVICVGGIIILSSGSVFKKKTREEYLEELAKHLEAELIPHPDFGDSFKLTFKHEGKELTFEDLNTGGFKQVNYKGYLKRVSASSLTIDFTERPRNKMKGKVIKASEITDEEIQSLNVPKKLKKFVIYTNNIILTNKLFEEEDFLRILDEFQYVDVRGNPVLPIKIQEGVVGLEYRESIEIKPNLENLRENPTRIDRNIEKVYRLAQLIDAKEDELRRRNK